MSKVSEIPAEVLIREVAKDLKDKIERPDWALNVKTGASRERSPDDPDYWWTRAASILRKIYLSGPIGVQKLRVSYGGKKHRGRKPEEFRKSSGKIIRTLLQDLDKLGFTEKTEKKKDGRKITPMGQSYLDKIASAIKKNG